MIYHLIEDGLGQDKECFFDVYVVHHRANLNERNAVQSSKLK